MGRGARLQNRGDRQVFAKHALGQWAQEGFHGLATSIVVQQVGHVVGVETKRAGVAFDLFVERKSCEELLPPEEGLVDAVALQAVDEGLVRSPGNVVVGHLVVAAVEPNSGARHGVHRSPEGGVRMVPHDAVQAASLAHRALPREACRPGLRLRDGLAPCPIRRVGGKLPDGLGNTDPGHRGGTVRPAPRHASGSEVWRVRDAVPWGVWRVFLEIRALEIPERRVPEARGVRKALKLLRSVVLTKTSVGDEEAVVHRPRDGLVGYVGWDRIRKSRIDRDFPRNHTPIVGIVRCSFGVANRALFEHHFRARHRIAHIPENDRGNPSELRALHLGVDVAVVLRRVLDARAIVHRGIQWASRTVAAHAVSVLVVFGVPPALLAGIANSVFVRIFLLCVGHIRAVVVDDRPTIEPPVAVVVDVLSARADVVDLAKPEVGVFAVLREPASRVSAVHGGVERIGQDPGFVRVARDVGPRLVARAAGGIHVARSAGEHADDVPGAVGIDIEQRAARVTGTTLPVVLLHLVLPVEAALPGRTVHVRALEGGRLAENRNGGTWNLGIPYWGPARNRYLRKGDGARSHAGIERRSTTLWHQLAAIEIDEPDVATGGARVDAIRGERASLIEGPLPRGTGPGRARRLTEEARIPELAPEKNDAIRADRAALGVREAMGRRDGEARSDQRSRALPGRAIQTNDDVGFVGVVVVGASDDGLANRPWT